MDFINQAIEQVRELFLSMTPAARMTSVLLVGVIGVSLGFLFQQQSAGPDEYLFGGTVLSPHDANRIDLALAQGGLSSYDRVGNRFLVPSGNKADYLGAIGNAGVMPVDPDQLIPEILGGMSDFSSNSTQQELLKATKEHRMSLIVSRMNGVESAKVIYDINKGSGLSRKLKGTASVSVRPEPNQPLDAHQTKRIKEMVAASIAGLSMSDVHVTDETNGGIYGGMGKPITADMFDDPYYPTKIRFEALMTEKIANLISYIPDTKIEVTAILDETSKHTKTSIIPEGEVAPLHDSSIEEEVSSTRKENGGRPGLEANGPYRAGAETDLATDESTSSTTDKETVNYVGTTEEFLEMAGFIPQQVRATIAIPSNYLVQIWREKNPDEAKDAIPETVALEALKIEVKKNIKDAITPLLPRLGKGIDPYEQVEMTVFQSITPPQMEGPSMTSHAMGWLGKNANNMMMGGLALASLAMLRSMVKSIPSSSTPSSTASPALSLHTANDESASKGSKAGSSSDTESEAISRPRLKLKKRSQSQG